MLLSVTHTLEDMVALMSNKLLTKLACNMSTHLADLVGKRHAPPVVDGRITKGDTLKKLWS